MKSLVIDNLVIEVTRKCNMQCEHCLRGKAENKYFEPSLLSAFIKNNNIKSISTITFTGGEPTLYGGFLELLAIFEDNKVSVGNFYIATNGKISQGRCRTFVQAMVSRYSYCYDKENCIIELSNDIFHEEIKIPDELQLLRIFRNRFIKDKYNYYHYTGLLAEGNAEYLGTREVVEYDLVIEIEENTINIRETQIYLNCRGEIINGCDWSYKNQRYHKIGSVNQNIHPYLESKISENDLI